MATRSSLIDVEKIDPVKLHSLAQVALAAVPYAVWDLDFQLVPNGHGFMFTTGLTCIRI